MDGATWGFEATSMIGTGAVAHNAGRRGVDPVRSGNIPPAFFRPDLPPMRLSTYPVNTLRDVPADAEVVSHQLMLRASLIRREAAGLYTWLPIGLRVLRKVENIVREEMNRAGAFELLMPTLQPAELWVESGRWEHFGPELLRLKDRNERPFCYGPTHEEVITDIARRELKSYRQLPVNFYQIQTKFRDEIRPRFGVMRAREFTMKDAYSFHLDAASLEEGYQAMYRAYTRIFERMQLKFRAVRADTGSIGGSASQEFHVLADSGEDAIAFSDGDDYAANLEMAEALAPAAPRGAATAVLQKVATPNVRTIEDLTKFLGVPAAQCLKTLLVEGTAGQACGDDRARRPRTERGQGTEAARRGVAPAHGQRRAGRRRDRRGAGFHRPGRPRVQGLRGPRGGAGGGFRLRRERARHPPHRGQLDPRPAGGRKSSTSATCWRATRARRARAGWASPAASKSVTFSSWVASTARP